MYIWNYIKNFFKDCLYDLFYFENKSNLNDIDIENFIEIINDA